MYFEFNVVNINKLYNKELLLTVYKYKRFVCKIKSKYLPRNIIKNNMNLCILYNYSTVLRQQISINKCTK